MPGGGGGALGDALPFEAGGGGVEDGAPHRRLLHPRGGLPWSPKQPRHALTGEGRRGGIARESGSEEGLEGCRRAGRGRALRFWRG